MHHTPLTNYQIFEKHHWVFCNHKVTVSIFSTISQGSFCNCFHENGPPSSYVWILETPSDGTVWQGWRSMASFKGVCHWEQALRFQKTHYIPSVLSPSCLQIKMTALNCFCYHAFEPPSQTLTLWTYV